jgi:hypothetical protein
MAYPIGLALTVLAISLFLCWWVNYYFETPWERTHQQPIVRFGEALDALGRTWDSEFYSDIAEHGYSPDRPKNYAFFPLFPLEIRWVAKALRMGIPRAALLANALNFTALVTSLWAFFRAFADRFRKQIDADEVLLLSLMLPCGLFLWVAYTESLFALWTVLFFGYLLFGGSGWRTAWVVPLLAVLASLTRSPGVGLVLAAWVDLGARLWASGRERWREHLPRAASALGATVGSAAALGLLFLKFERATGDFWVSKHVQTTYWNRSAEFEWRLWRPLVEYLGKYLPLGPGCQGNLECDLNVSNTLIAAVLGVLALVLCAVFWRKYRASGLLAMLAHSIFCLALPLSTNSTTSFNRLGLVSPAYLLVLPLATGLYLPRGLQKILQVGLTLFQAMFFIQFASSFWFG